MRTTLKVLETLTYSCASPQDLYELTAKVEQLITNFRGKLPQSEGIILRPEARKSVRKRAQQILKKYRPLPRSVRRGRQKCDWRHRNRVGQKAAELRKVNYQYVHPKNCTCMYTEIHVQAAQNMRVKKQERTNTVQISQPIDTTEPNLNETECTVKSQPLHSHTDIVKGSIGKLNIQWISRCHKHMYIALTITQNTFLTCSW